MKSEATAELINQHQQVYGDHPEYLAIAPGRAEILGNHTDYNKGFTLSANIQNRLLAVANRRSDMSVSIYSTEIGGQPIEFSINSSEEVWQQRAESSSTNSWANYCKSVLWSYLKAGHKLVGFNATISSDIPSGGGLSSSAAFETAISRLVNKFADLDVSPEDQVQLSKRAENEYVGAPCGNLDQATIGLSKQWLLMDHRPYDNQEFSYQHLEATLEDSNLQFVIGYDPDSKHSLVDGKYAARRQACLDSLPILSELTGRHIVALRDINTSELTNLEARLRQRMSEQDYNYISHVVHENQRVIDAVSQLSQGNFSQLGDLMTQSGRSALDLYRLDEDSPELREVYDYVVDHAANLGVAGIRNMGGGFNATTLALVDSQLVDIYCDNLNKHYRKCYGRPYQLISFRPAPAASVVALTEN